MAAKNGELRGSTGTTFDGTDQLVYLRTHISLVDGLLVNNKFNESYLPASAFGGTRLVDTITVATRTTVELNALIAAFIATNGGTARGTFFITGINNCVLTCSAADVIHTEDGILTGAGTVSLTNSDVVLCITGVGESVNYVYSVVHNNQDEATTTVGGFMSASDKVKLNGIATGANLYTHPTQTAINVDVSNVSENKVVSKVIVNASGHVTEVGWYALNPAGNGYNGLMSAEDKDRLDGMDDNANNYSHPAQAAINLTPSTIETIASIVSNATGHLTTVTKQTIRSASETLTGVIEIATAAEAKVGTDNTRALTPAGGKAMIDLFAGLKAYATLALANADIANNPAGKLALIYV